MYNRGQLVSVITNLMVPQEDLATTSTPPELFAILGALSNLDSSASYVVYDPEQSPRTLSPSDDQLAALCALSGNGTVLCSWDGSAPDSFGYGDLVLLPNGAGLYFSVTGSSMSSAIPLWVVKAGTL